MEQQPDSQDAVDAAAERFLRRHLQLPSPGVAAPTSEEATLIREAAQPRRGTRSIVLIALAVAACLVAGITIHRLQPFSSTGIEGPAARAAVTVPSAAEHFTILDAVPPVSIVVQEMRAFHIRPVRCGEPLGADSLAAVSADAVSIQHPSGQTVERKIAAINRDAETALTAEIGALANNFQALGNLSDEEWTRVRDMAAYGSDDALSLLQMNSSRQASDSPEARQLHAVQLAADWARKGSRKSRLSAIQGLRDEHTPYAFRALVDLATALDDDMATLCVEALRSYPEIGRAHV